MWKRINTYIKSFIIIGLMLFISTSCSTTRKISMYEIKPMSAGKIIRKVDKETPKYKNYESKKIALSYQDNESKQSLSGQFKIDKDKNIILTLKKLNLPVSRVLITPDSLTLINYFDKNYIQDDIEKLQKLIGIEIDYNKLQALLTADVSEILRDDEFDKTLVSYIDENMYRIDSQLNSKINKALSTGNDKRLNRYLKKMDDSEFINYSIWIDPQFFVIRKLIFENIKYKESLIIHYDQFELVGQSLFPQQIKVELLTPKQNMAVEMKLSKPSVNKEKDFNFNIPEKYEKSNL